MKVKNSETEAIGAAITGSLIAGYVIRQDVLQHPSLPRCITGACEFNIGGYSVMDNGPIQGRVKLLPTASCYKTWDKFRLYIQLVPV